MNLINHQPSIVGVQIKKFLFGGSIKKSPPKNQLVTLVRKRMVNALNLMRRLRCSQLETGAWPPSIWQRRHWGHGDKLISGTPKYSNFVKTRIYQTLICPKFVLHFIWQNHSCMITLLGLSVTAKIRLN